MALIDPFKHVGPCSAWGKFGDGANDEAADAEKRATCAFFLRRLAKGERRGVDATVDILAGGMVAMAGLFIAAKGGPDKIDDEDFERFVSVASFSWMMALSHDAGGGTQ